VILTDSPLRAVGAELSSTLQRFGGVRSSANSCRRHGHRTGPLITGLMVAGGTPSGMASELGSMIVTEQIDAMRALGTDPTKS